MHSVGWGAAPVSPDLRAACFLGLVRVWPCDSFSLALATAAAWGLLKLPTLSRLRPRTFKVACHGRFLEALRCTPT